MVSNTYDLTGCAIKLSRLRSAYQKARMDRMNAYDEKERAWVMYTNLSQTGRTAQETKFGTNLVNKAANKFAKSMEIEETARNKLYDYESRLKSERIFSAVERLL